MSSSSSSKKLVNLDIIDKTSSSEAEDIVEIADNPPPPPPKHVNVYVFPIFFSNTNLKIYFTMVHDTQARHLRNEIWNKSA